MNKLNKIFWSSKTHIGNYRKENEDSLAMAKLKAKDFKVSISDSNGIIKNHEKGSLFVVADGMGGHSFGKEASWLAIREWMYQCQNILPSIYSKNKDSFLYDKLKKDELHKVFKSILEKCHQKIEEENINKRTSFNPEEQKFTNFSDYMKKSKPKLNMGTTLSGFWLINDFIILSHIGDSRIYRIQNEQLQMLTIDHSYVGTLLREGIINERQAKSHPRRSTLQQALGSGVQTIQPFVKDFEVKSGDAF